MGEMVIPESIWEKTKEHLLHDEMEHFAFLLASVTHARGKVSFLVKDVFLINDKDLDFSGHSMLNLDTFLEVTNAARSRGLAVVEAHSHPFTRDDVSFSLTDEHGFEDFVNYMLEDLGLPYGATVWGRESIEGRCWHDDGSSEPMLGVRVVGKNLVRVPTTSGKKLTRESSRSYEGLSRFDRQLRAVGNDGQKKIENTKVAIVGAGGIGSHVIQQLAHLGVKNVAIIDFDEVEETNLNRLIGATPNDVGKQKTVVMEKMVLSITGKKGINVCTFNAGVREPEALSALKRADVIFGCVDNYGARLILNEVALAYMIPLIDCGSGIHAKDGEIIEAGGRIVVVQPDGPCLLCAKEISPAEAYNDLAPPEEIEFKRDLGYVSGEDVKSPSVVSLNGTIASMAVTEFVALVTGARPTSEYTFYDLLEQKTVERIVKPNPKCYLCSLKGMGDRADVERYSSSLSRDEPAGALQSIKEKLISSVRHIGNRLVSSVEGGLAT